MAQNMSLTNISHFQPDLHSKYTIMHHSTFLFTDIQEEVFAGGDCGLHTHWLEVRTYAFHLLSEVFILSVNEMVHLKI
jgi:hypothetical protein